jgi:hypothetical protein
MSERDFYKGRERNREINEEKNKIIQYEKEWYFKTEIIDGEADKSVKITKHNIKYPSRIVRIPSIIQDLPVTVIGEEAFYEVSGEDWTINRLAYVIIPDSVTSIEERAFANNQLYSVTIPDSVTSIGRGAFARNPLTSITISSNVSLDGGFIFPNGFDDFYLSNESIAGTYIYNNEEWRREKYLLKDETRKIFFEHAGELAFEIEIKDAEKSGASVKILRYFGEKKEVQIPPIIQELPVTEIGDNAFRDNQLVRVYIPDSITIIGNWAFANNQLTDVEIPESITSLGKGVFAKNQITGVRIPDNITSIGEEALMDNQITDVVIPESVTRIGRGAFAGNKLTSVTIHSDINIGSSSGFAFPNEFDDFYLSNKNIMGTYTYSNGEWKRE